MRLKSLMLQSLLGLRIHTRSFRTSRDGLLPSHHLLLFSVKGSPKGTSFSHHHHSLWVRRGLNVRLYLPGKSCATFGTKSSSTGNQSLFMGSATICRMIKCQKSFKKSTNTQFKGLCITVVYFPKRCMYSIKNT